MQCQVCLFFSPCTNEAGLVLLRVKHYIEQGAKQEVDPVGQSSGGTMWEARAADFSDTLLLGSDNKDLLPAPPPGVAACRRNTVKELLVMKRQRWNLSLEDQCVPAKLLRLSGDVLPLPPLGPMMPPPPLQQSAEANATLFQWQIQQEERRVGGVPLELLHTADGDGDTFLHIAVAKGRRALAFALAARMSASGCLDLKEHNGQTALQLAAATNQHLIVQDLLTHGARVDTHDLWGRSALHVCAEKGHFLTLQSIWGTLMGRKQHVDVDIFNYDGQTPLHAAVQLHNAVVKELRKQDSLPQKMELLQRKKVYLDCIKILMLMGASAGTKDLKSGRTSIHMACEEANVEVLNVLVHQPSSPSFINTAMFNGNTALHVACSLQGHRGQVEAVKLLLRRGADSTSRNVENEVPSQLVPQGPTGEKVQLLLKKHV